VTISVTGGWNVTGSDGGVGGGGGVGSDVGGCEKSSVAGSTGGSSVVGVVSGVGVGSDCIGTGGCAPGVLCGCGVSRLFSDGFSSFGCIYPLF